MVRKEGRDNIDMYVLLREMMELEELMIKGMMQCPSNYRRIGNEENHEQV